MTREAGSYRYLIILVWEEGIAAKILKVCDRRPRLKRKSQIASIDKLQLSE
jgi:hypothetical protein